MRMDAALAEAARKARGDYASPRTLYLRAKATFERWDALSRTRALTDLESRAMGQAMRRMQDWGARI